MAALRPARRMLLFGIVMGALTLAAPPAGALVVLPPAQAVTVAALLNAEDRGGAEASLQYVHLGRFCQWHSRHLLCHKLVLLRRFCDRRPDHRLCDDGDDPFCRRHPYHRRCDKPPSPS
jgi:hypothetical protein